MLTQLPRRRADRDSGAEVGETHLGADVAQARTAITPGNWRGADRMARAVAGRGDDDHVPAEVTCAHRVV